MVDRIYTRPIPEEERKGKRLGRHVKHDPRSLRYLVAAGPREALVSVRHERRIPVLDQGDLGSCTGNAAEGACGTGALFDAIPGDQKNKPDTTDAYFDEQEAVALYSTATGLDTYQGTYPPEDTGSDGLSVAKAAKRAGLISGYRHATSLDAALTALAAGPVIAGINWYSSFDRPSGGGVISIGADAYVRGGHEICVDELDVERERIGFTNSWGDSWGQGGRAYIGWDDFERLLAEDGDVTVFVPLSQPAPTPTPDPPSDNPFEELGALILKGLKAMEDAVEGWLSKHGVS